MAHLLEKTDRLLLRLDIVLASAAAVAIIVMMLVTAADVVMRYGFNAPLHWAYDLITQYLLVASFFFGFSYTLRRNQHISVDFFARRLPEWQYHLWLSLGCFVAGCIFTVIAWLGAEEALSAWRNDEVIFGALIWPVWLSKIIIPVGIAPLALRCFHRVAAHLCLGDRPMQRQLGIGIDQLATAKD